MGPFIGGIFLVAIGAALLFVFAAPAYKNIGDVANIVMKPFRQEEEKERDVFKDRNGEKNE